MTGAGGRRGVQCFHLTLIALLLAGCTAAVAPTPDSTASPAEASIREAFAGAAWFVWLTEGPDGRLDVSLENGVLSVGTNLSRDDGRGIATLICRAIAELGSDVVVQSGGTTLAECATGSAPRTSFGWGHTGSSSSRNFATVE